MFKAELSREIAVPAEIAWSLLVDWGNTVWLPGPEKTEVVTRGQEVTRRLFIPGAEPIEETMLENDPAGMTLNYTIAVSELFQLADYSGRIAVEPSDHGCRVIWGSCFSQGEMSDEEAGAAASGNLNFLLDSLKGYLEQSAK
jgi:hypothetical protein